MVDYKLTGWDRIETPLDNYTLNDFNEKEI